MIDSFMRMYGFIHDINNKLPMTNLKRVEVSVEFFRDLEKVFDEIENVISHCPLFESTKKDND